MSRVCDVCGKRPITGNRASHSLRHTRRVWAPNLQRVHAVVDGKKKWIRVCTRCIRSEKVIKAA
jgi:large subunit ribosomal protein L28